MIPLYEDDLDWAAQAGFLRPEQVAPLWQALGERAQARPRFSGVTVAYYGGALVVMAALGLFLTLAWENLGGWGIFALALVYGLGLSACGYWLSFRQGLTIPGGLLFTAAVWMTPLAVYGLQRALGFWSQGDPGQYANFYTWIRGSWFLMEISTLIIGTVALYFVRFPFLTFPLAWCLWFLSMDVAPLFFGTDVEFRTRAWVSFWLGLWGLVLAYLVDLRCPRSRGDYAFWLYLFGLLSFWPSLPFTGADTEWSRFLYFLVNLGLMILSVALRRRLLMVFGALGVFGYLSYLAFQVFAESLLFPLALSALGLGLIALGVFYQRHCRRWEQYFERRWPAAQSFLPKE
jgi:hypothetical protein